MRNEEVLHRDKEERNILCIIKRRKVNLIGHILHRHCCLAHIIEGKIGGGIEGMRRRGRKRKYLLDDLKGETRDCKLKEEALDRSV